MNIISYHILSKSQRRKCAKRNKGAERYANNNKNLKKPGQKEMFFSWHLKVLTESTRRSGEGSLFNAHGKEKEVDLYSAYRQYLDH